MSNNPLIYVDPTGHFGLLATLGIAAVVGAAVGAVGSYVVQVASNVVEDGFSADDLTNVDGKEIIAGAVSGAVGATVGVVGAALGAVGVMGVVVTGVIGGAASGQASKAAMNVMDGRKWSEGLGKTRDLIRDGVIGGVTAGIGYGIGKYVKAKFQKYKGGAIDDLDTRVNGKRIERHHLIQDDISPFETGEAPGIQMDPTDHYKTATHGIGGHDGQPFKEATRRFIEKGQNWRALAQGIKDVISCSRMKYDWAIMDAIGYTIKSGLFAR